MTYHLYGMISPVPTYSNFEPRQRREIDSALVMSSNSTAKSEHSGSYSRTYDWLMVMS